MNYEDELQWVPQAWAEISGFAALSSPLTVRRQTSYVALMRQLLELSDSPQPSSQNFRVTAKSFEI